MKVTCAWCKREGRPALIAEQAPLEDQRETHGICRRHITQMMADVPASSFPGVRLLLVIARHETKLYENLADAFGGTTGITIMTERRRGDRRQRRAGVTVERRQSERRVRLAEISLLGYTLVRFGKGQTTKGPAGSAS